MDREISEYWDDFEKRGVSIHTGAMVQKITADDGTLCCQFAKGDQNQSVRAQGVLVAIGRRPNTEGLFESEMTPEMERGRIVTNEDFSPLWNRSGPLEM